LKFWKATIIIWRHQHWQTNTWQKKQSTGTASSNNTKGSVSIGSSSGRGDSNRKKVNNNATVNW